jgi:hypothetical protein
MTRRWGKAGVRLTAVEATDSARKRSVIDAIGDQKHAEMLRIARIKWASGLVIPDHITVALDMGNHYGPEVDAACLAAEPEVDLWEAGRLYPRWEQVRALSKLTGFGEVWLMGPPRQRVSWRETSLKFHYPPSDEPEPKRVFEFTRAALDAAAAIGVTA